VAKSQANLRQPSDFVVRVGNGKWEKVKAEGEVRKRKSMLENCQRQGATTASRIDFGAFGFDALTYNKGICLGHALSSVRPRI